jgi:TIR domain
MSRKWLARCFGIGIGITAQDSLTLQNHSLPPSAYSTATATGTRPCVTPLRHIWLCSDERGSIASWHDRRIIAGQEWKGQIDRHLDEADIILLLVSADFLASDNCYEVEMQRALVRHQAGKACVIPIIIRLVDGSSALFVSLQALPKDAKAVASWKDTDEARTDVARGIRHAAEEIRKRRPPS